MRCTADRLVTGVVARRVWPNGPDEWRTIKALTRHVSYGTPELVVSFSDGSYSFCPVDSMWEVK